MSLINTNHDYLRTMGLQSTSPVVGAIVAVYYLGCAVGSVIFSKLADKLGRKKSIFGCLATAALGNFIMFVTGLGSWKQGTLTSMIVGRVIMGLGVGGIDAVIPIYSSELASDDARGKALAQEFQMNIFGLNMAFAINLLVTRLLGKENQWAWRIPIVVMQAYPLLLLAVIERLPESPRWFIYHGREEEAEKAMLAINGQEEGEEKFKALKQSAKDEQDQSVSYLDMLTPGHPQFHPTVVAIMGQTNQALTGYGAVSVYGPQIFELLGFDVKTAEDLTQANYISYFVFMTLAWLLIDAVGRRSLMVIGSMVLTACFALLTLFGGLAMNIDHINIPYLAAGIPGTITLFVATWAFGIGWLATVCKFILFLCSSITLLDEVLLCHFGRTSTLHGRTKNQRTTKIKKLNGLTTIHRAHPHRTLHHHRPGPSSSHLRNSLGPRKLRHHLPHPSHVQQPQILHFPRLRSQ